MGQPAAKRGDRITAMDTHLVVIPGSPPTTSLIGGHRFDAQITQDLSTDVYIDGQAVAVVGSVARANLAQHPPMAPGTSYSPPGPTFQGQVTTGSATVYVNGKQAARAGDSAMTCNDIVIPFPGSGTVQVASSTVSIG